MTSRLLHGHPSRWAFPFRNIQLQKRYFCRYSINRVRWNAGSRVQIPFSHCQTLYRSTNVMPSHPSLCLPRQAFWLMFGNDQKHHLFPSGHIAGFSSWSSWWVLFENTFRRTGEARILNASKIWNSICFDTIFVTPGRTVDYEWTSSGRWPMGTGY